MPEHRLNHLLPETVAAAAASPFQAGSKPSARGTDGRPWLSELQEPRLWLSIIVSAVRAAGC